MHTSFSSSFSVTHCLTRMCTHTHTHAKRIHTQTQMYTFRHTQKSGHTLSLRAYVFGNNEISPLDFTQGWRTGRLYVECNDGLHRDVLLGTVYIWVCVFMYIYICVSKGYSNWSCTTQYFKLIFLIFLSYFIKQRNVICLLYPNCILHLQTPYFIFRLNINSIQSQ